MSNCPWCNSKPDSERDAYMIAKGSATRHWTCHSWYNKPKRMIEQSLTCEKLELKRALRRLKAKAASREQTIRRLASEIH